MECKTYLILAKEFSGSKEKMHKRVFHFSKQMILTDVEKQRRLLGVALSLKQETNHLMTIFKLLNSKQGQEYVQFKKKKVYFLKF